ncbi:peptidoglycan DD-metalloendopeptidase family protein [bacterium]|nr:peptidoglycan DD-metalloendopeptidase family protein [bacterium]MBU4510753.1 peptidoglycan DD-metalloendopeptidase family protein [bacterium]
MVNSKILFTIAFAAIVSLFCSLACGEERFIQPCPDAGGYFSWLGGPGENHLGHDYNAPADTKVKAIADGTIFKIFEIPAKCYCPETETELSQPFVWIKHRLSNGQYFFALYGHIEPYKNIKEGVGVEAGQGIGKIKECYVWYKDKLVPAPHLHFGIWNSESPPPIEKVGYGPARSFVDPIEFLKKNKPYIEQTTEISKTPPVITSPLKITPAPPYYYGDIINAEFTITNQGKLPIKFSVLTVGGRDSDNQVADFSHRQNIILKPFESYNYQGTLTLNKVGNYNFFCVYQTPDGNWNTCVDLGSGLTDEDRTKEVVVIARESEDTPSVSLGYPEKILPVKPRIIGKPAPGYYISQILAKPDEIKIFGNYSKINNLEFLETIPINVSGITKTLSVKVPPALNEGLNIVEGKTTLIEVTIQVKEALVQKTLPDEEEVTEASSSKDYFPLDEGRKWEYQVLLKEGGGWYPGPESEISGKQIITNFPQRELEGKKVTPQQVNYILRGSSRTSFWFYIEDQSSVYEFAHQKTGQIEPEIAYDIIINYPIKIGNSWQETETSAFKPEISIPVESTIKSINEIVTVPAGTFEGCLKIKTIGFAEKVTGKWLGLGEEEKVRIDGESYKWFAPGVGLIKAIFKEKKTCTGGIIPFDPPPEFREVTIQLETFK